MFPFSIVAMMEEIQNSLPSNSTAITYTSSIPNITNYILNPKKGMFFQYKPVNAQLSYTYSNKIQLGAKVCTPLGQYE